MQVAEPETDAAAREVVGRFGVHLSAGRGLSPHTVRAYLGDVRHVIAFAGRRGVAWDRIDLALLRSWLGSMVAARLSRSTIARRGAAVRCFFAWAHEEGLVPDDPAARLVTAQPRPALPTALAVAPAARLVESARETAADDDPVALRDWALVELLYATGVRVSEAAGLDVDDVDLGQRLVRVMGKGGKERVVPFGAPAARAVQAWLGRGRPQLARPGSGPRSCSVCAVAGRTPVSCAAPCTARPRSRASTTSRRTHCVTRPRRTCCRAGRTYVRCRSCSDMPVWRPHSDTPT